MTTSGGRHEIAAAKQRLEAAKVQASSAEENLESAKAIEENAQAMMESAKAMLVRAKKSRESAQAQVDFSQKEVEQAEECLEMSEKRWAVIDIESEDDEVEEKISKKLEQPAEDVVIAADDEDEENVSPNVMGFGHSSGAVGAVNPSDLGAIVVLNCGFAQVNGTYKRSKYINGAPSFCRKGIWTRMARDIVEYILFYRENYWYIELHDPEVGVDILYRTRNPISYELLPCNDWTTFGDLASGPGPILIF